MKYKYIGKPKFFYNQLDDIIGGNVWLLRTSFKHYFTKLVIAPIYLPFDKTNYNNTYNGIENNITIIFKI